MRLIGILSYSSGYIQDIPAIISRVTVSPLSRAGDTFDEKVQLLRLIACGFVYPKNFGTVILDMILVRHQDV
jgi:hypothetical protein